VRQEFDYPNPFKGSNAQHCAEDEQADGQYWTSTAESDQLRRKILGTQLPPGSARTGDNEKIPRIILLEVRDNVRSE